MRVKEALFLLMGTVYGWLSVRSFRNPKAVGAGSPKWAPQVVGFLLGLAAILSFYLFADLVR
jgi:hypothetical protein